MTTRTCEGHSSLAAAIKTIVVADLVMSLDNVVGVAAAAKGNVPLLVFGLVISIPLIIFGSTLILKLMGALPGHHHLGAALLGWVAGEMAMTDPAIVDWAADQHALHNDGACARRRVRGRRSASGWHRPPAAANRHPAAV